MAGKNKASRMQGRWWLAALWLLVCAVPAHAVSGNPSGCPAWEGEVLLVKSMTLPRGCVYRGVELRVNNQQGLMLDMNGARFDADGQPIRGLWIMNTDPEQPSQQIEFRNAVFTGYREGARIHRNISPEEADAVRAGHLTSGQIRATATHDVLIENVQFLNSIGDGVVFHGGVHDVVLRRSVVANSGGVGVYLGDMTYRIELAGNRISGNGYRKLDGSPRRGRGRRENIAIDASFSNHIHHNQILDGAEGGIALYKNCYEHAGDAGQLPRTDHASDNRIHHNTVSGNNGYGIHIAERQDWELSAFNCGDPVYYTRGGRYYRDYAEGNAVEDNVVTDNGKDIVVQGDNNILKRNRSGGIWIGSRVRAAVGEPVRGTVLHGNRGAVHYPYGGS